MTLSAVLFSEEDQPVPDTVESVREVVAVRDVVSVRDVAVINEEVLMESSGYVDINSEITRFVSTFQSITI